MSIKQYSEGTIDEMGMRTLIGELGYEIVLNVKGYILEDKSGRDRRVSDTFDTIKDICKYLEPELKAKHGDFKTIELTEEEKHGLKIESLIEELMGLSKVDKVKVSMRLVASVNSDVIFTEFINIDKDSLLGAEVDGQSGREKLIEISTAKDWLEECESDADKAILKTITSLEEIGIYDVIIGS